MGDAYVPGSGRMNGMRFCTYAEPNDDPGAAVGKVKSLWEADALQNAPVELRRRRFGQAPAPVEDEPMDYAKWRAELARLRAQEETVEYSRCMKCTRQIRARKGSEATGLCYICASNRAF